MTPTTIEQYLEQLSDALRGEDAALIQDALSDAEDYLRNELNGVTAADWERTFPAVVARFGTPSEVAEAYRQGSAPTRPGANLTPVVGATPTGLERFFRVAVDVHAWGAFFYLLLSLVTGVFLFTVVAVGLSLSLGLSILIFGIPVALGFLAMVRGLALAEGRLIEATVGVRMPRRPIPNPASGSLWARINSWIVDSRTWLTIVYMALKLPLGILYFSLMVVLMSLSLSFLLSPIAAALGSPVTLITLDGSSYEFPFFASLVLALIGFVGFFITLHTARGLGRLHASLAKAMLVRP